MIRGVLIECVVVYLNFFYTIRQRSFFDLLNKTLLRYTVKLPFVETNFLTSKAAYIHVLNQTCLYLRKSLDSTGLPPHFAIYIDKSTPHRDTNQAIMIIITYNGRWVSMPVDAPSVYECSDDDGTIQGGTEQDLAQQVFEVLTQKLDLTLPELAFLQGEWERN